MSSHRLPPKKSRLGDYEHIYQLKAVERDKTPTPFDAEVIQIIRDIAGELGYAIAVHGTLVRDIDLVACPWTADAVDAFDLVQAIIHRRSAVISGMEKKPHGRVAYTLKGFHDCNKAIDLSIFPIRGAAV